MIDIKEATKSYAKVTAVNNVSLAIPRGQIFGLLGPNGAGKSTLINMLCGLLLPDTGSILISGLDLKKKKQVVKRSIGMIPQDLAIYEDLSAKANVRFFGSLYGLRGRRLREAAHEALVSVGLDEQADRLPSSFSGGMKRRLNIACGIVHKPELIIFDEPTVGIDPQSRNYILETIQSLNRHGSTIVYTTHYMEEADQICKEIAIMDHGKIIAQGTSSALKGLITDQTRLVIRTRQTAEHLVERIQRIQGVAEVDHREDQLIINNHRDVNNLGQVIALLNENKISIDQVQNDVPNLEMVFLTLTGRSLRD